MKMVSRKKQSAFALLLTLVVVSVVLAIGLSMLHITTKQLSLSNAARDSEIAIHAARTGIECMQYHRNKQITYDNLINDDGSNSSAPVLYCAGVSPVAGEYGTDHATDVFNYYYTYNVGGSSCVETSLYLLDARAIDNSTELTYSISEGLTSLSCRGGSVCTTIFSRGFNRACADRDSFFTVQRELTLQF